MSDPARFWETTPLEELNKQQWEALCDGCGRCCAVKLQHPDTGEVHYTQAACRLLDTDTCRCSDYPNRARRVPDCVVLDPEKARRYEWLPETCAYRLRATGQPLAWWHPLVSGSPATVHEAGISVRGRLISEQHIHPDELAMLVADLQELDEHD